MKLDSVQMKVLKFSDLVCNKSPYQLNSSEKFGTYKNW